MRCPRRTSAAKRPLSNVAWPLPHEELIVRPKTTSFMTVCSNLGWLSVLFSKAHKRLVTRPTKTPAERQGCPERPSRTEQLQPKYSFKGETAAIEGIVYLLDGAPVG